MFENLSFESIEDAAKYYDSIIASMPGHVFWKDKQGYYLGCNELQAISNGLASRHDIVGNTDYDLMPKEQADAITRLDQEIMRTGEAQETDEVLTKSNGDTCFFHSKKTPLFDNNGKVIGILGVSFDITVEKDKLKKSQFKEKNQYVSIKELIKNIKDPLSGVICLTQVLQCKKTDERQSHCLSALLSQAEKIHRAIKRAEEYLDILDEDMNLFDSKDNIRHLLRRIYSDYDETAKQKKIDFKLSFDESVPQLIESKLFYLSQVIRDVLDNAFKYTHQGSIEINVSSFMKKGVNYLDLTIIDSGQGIRKETLDHIFDFFEAHNEKIDDFEKSGLVLSIAAKLIEKMNGTISIESAVNQGTTVAIKVPYKKLNDGSIILESRKHILNIPEEISSSRKERNINVLIIEDSTLAQFTMKELLDTLYTCNIDQAYTIKDAMTKIDNPYDIILLDINLPDGLGIEFSQAFRDLGKDTPIIAISAHSYEDIIDDVNMHGITDNISKPISIEKISNIIDDYVFNQ